QQREARAVAGDELAPEQRLAVRCQELGQTDARAVAELEDARVLPRLLVRVVRCDLERLAEAGAGIARLVVQRRNALVFANPQAAPRPRGGVRRQRFQRQRREPSGRVAIAVEQRSRLRFGHGRAPTAGAVCHTRLCQNVTEYRPVRSHRRQASGQAVHETQGSATMANPRELAEQAFALLQDALRSSEARAADLDAQLKRERPPKTKLEEQVDVLTHRLAALEAEAAKWRATAGQLEEIAEAERAKVSQLRKKLSIAESGPDKLTKKEVNFWRAKAEEFDTETRDYRNRLAALRKELQERDKQIEKLQRDLDKVAAAPRPPAVQPEEIAALEARLEEYQRREAEQREALAAREADLERLSARAAELEHALAAHEEALARKDAAHEEALAARDSAHQQALAARDQALQQALAEQDAAHQQA